MTVVAGPFFAAASLLGAAGAAKLVRPASTIEALRAAQLPGIRSRRRPLEKLLVGRLIGLIEATLAIAALMLGGRVTAVALAVVYLGFSLFTARLLRTAGAGASCGCFGAESSPAAPLHVVVNGGLALIAALAAAWPTPGLREVLGDQPLLGLPFVGLCAVLAWMVFAVLTAVPELQASMAATATVDARSKVR